ncbi:MAG: 4Fe-4S dicluster domain-containing protein [Candidatus Electryonea clarkiae]|nr:4Fe-4S dicluster domain-containing protein [Candidatus Electryonea clarkiae]MDP8286135.1 4Fe-4S dicluster domain-containing protein [Candidatus Electryonea clarkiae]
MSDTAVVTEEVQEVKAEMVPVYIMGKRYDVPNSLTIMKAMEYAGYQYIRGAGCRGGVCGACATVYRLPGDYHIRVGLACQTVVEPNMYLTQIPFFPANRAVYDWENIKGEAEEVFQAYPELFRCLACNACTKVCPMDVPVMDYVAAIKRGDLEKAAELSFDCIQCGLCATRCMAEMAQYHIAQMVRRINGKFIAPHSEHCHKQVEAIKSGYYTDKIKEVMELGTVDPFDDSTKTDKIDKLIELYKARETEPHTAVEDWKPESDFALLK